MKQQIKNIILLLIELIELIEYRKLNLNQNDTTKKIIDEINIDEKVLTDTGFSNSSKIYKTQPYNIYEIKTENGLTLRCADNHIVFDENMNEIFIKDLSVNSYIQSKQGITKVISIKKSWFKQSMYDLTIDDQNHRYYTNDILSHNTISSCIFIIWYSIFHGNKSVMMLANKEKTVHEIIKNCKDIYEYLPLWLKPGVTTWNAGSVRFENKTRLLTQACSKSVAIGFTADVLFCDEFAHIPPNFLESFWRSVVPTISSKRNSRIIVTSTPNGMNLFHRIWTKALKKENNFVPTRVDWFQLPYATEEWKQEMITALESQKLFDQEFGLQFIIEENSLLDSDTRVRLDRQVVEYVNKNIPFLNESRIPQYFWHPDFDVMELHKPENRFVLGFDFSEGVGKDYNVVNIFKLFIQPEDNYKNETEKSQNIKKYIRLELVGYFENNTMNIFDFNNTISDDITKMFDLNNVRISLEANDNRYLGFVKDLNNICTTRKIDLGEYTFINTYHTDASRIKKIGYKLNKQNRSALLRELADDIKKGTVVINSKKHIDQLKHFALEGGTFYKSLGVNDDLAMGSLSCQIFIQNCILFIMEYLMDNRVLVDTEDSDLDSGLDFITKHF